MAGETSLDIGRMAADPNIDDRWDRHAPVLLWLCFAIYLAGFGLSNYGEAFGERDSYRVMLGVVDALRNGKPMEGPLMYGQGGSPGYYGLIQLFAGAGVALADLDRALNLVTWVCVALCFPAMYLVGRGAQGGGLGTAAAVILPAAPIWAAVGAYAHPVWPAILLFLLALGTALLRERQPAGRRLGFDALVVVALAAAFSMRLDVVLMAPMMLAACVTERRFSLPAAVRLALLGALALAPIIVWKVIDDAPPPLEGGTLKVLADWHNPSRFVGLFGYAQVAYLRALNPLLIAACGFGAAYLILTRQWRLLLLTVPVVALNYLFWIPNPERERHFLYMVPALALLAGAVAGAILDGGLRTRLLRPATAVASLTLLALGFCLQISPREGLTNELAAGPLLILNGLACLGAARGRERIAQLPLTAAVAITALLALATVVKRHELVFNNPFRTDVDQANGCLAQALATAPTPDRLVVVAGDAHPLLVGVQKRTGATVDLTMDDPWIDARIGKGRYRFFIQSWLQKDVAAAARATAATEPVYLVADPAVAPETPALLAGAPNVTLLAFDTRRCAIALPRA